MSAKVFNNYFNRIVKIKENASNKITCKNEKFIKNGTEMSAKVFNNYFNRIVKIKEKIKNMNFVLFIMLTSIKC